MGTFCIAASGICLALLLAGCGVTVPDFSTEVWEGPAMRTLALPRVVFADAGPDPFCDYNLPDDVRRQMRRALERKGYRVVGAAMPERDNSYRPDPWATAGAAQMLELLPEEADAIVRVRIDRHLSLDSCSKDESRILEMEGAAELFLPGQATAVWQNRASGGDTSVGGGDELSFRVGAELARKLFLSFPPAGGR